MLEVGDQRLSSSRTPESLAQMTASAISASGRAVPSLTSTATGTQALALAGERHRTAARRRGRQRAKSQIIKGRRLAGSAKPDVVERVRRGEVHNTAKTPALAPPRISAPGPQMVDAPARHIESSLDPNHPGQFVLSGTQSATHSQRFPTMSKAPTSATQVLREPVGTTASTPTPLPFFVLQSSDLAAQRRVEDRGLK